MNPEQAILRKASGPLAAILKVGLRDHLQCAVFRKYSKQPLPASQMAADLGPAAPLCLVQAKLPHDFQVIQGHHCSAGGRQYTHLIMASAGGKLVSLILTRKQPGESLAAAFINRAWIVPGGGIREPWLPGLCDLRSGCAAESTVGGESGAGAAGIFVRSPRLVGGADHRFSWSVWEGLRPAKFHERLGKRSIALE